jgi:hypothetical protein
MSVIENVGFPSHLIDPREKGKDWVLQYCKAAYSSFENDNPREIFYHSRYKYEVQKSYALGNQSINKYKPLLGVDEEAKEDWLSVDWSVIPIVPKFRRIALGKLSKVDYNIVATPIDSLANEETKEYFAKTRAKLMILDAAKKVDPSLANAPELQLSPEEAKDMEELEMQMKYSFKHQMAIEAEEGIKLIFGQNEVHKLRYKVREDLFDHGVGGYKEFIDSNGAVKIRAVNPRNILINRCLNQDFSDASYIGEIQELTISDLKQMAQGSFTDDDYEQIAKSYIGLLGNPKEWPSSLSVYNKGYDRFRVRVLDIEFFSVNQMVMESRVDRRGNKIYARGKFEDTNKKKDKYERLAYKVVYKGKWIIGTNYIFDYGLATDMKRAKSSLMDTSLSYHLFAPEFFDMKAYGMMDQMIPIADAIQIAWYRLQNAINQARPKGIMIEMGALEEIPLGSGGKKMTPMKVLDLYNKTGTLVYRKSDAQGRQTNYKPIEELENGLGRDVMNYWTVIQNNIQLLRDITGMNEMTDGSTPDPRTLTTVARMANESTNNALSHIITGERNLMESLAGSVMLRLQDVVSRGTVEGYVRSLGNNSLRFIKLSPKVSMHEYGIFLEDKPTDDQKAQLIAQVQAMAAQGLMDLEDSIIIQNTDNLKVAQQLLAYRAKKRKEQAQMEDMARQQMNGQIQTQSAQAAEQAKQQTIQLEGQVKGQLIQIEKEFDAKLMKMKYDYELQLEQIRMTGKVTTKHMENVGKTNVQKIKQGMPGDEMDQSVQIEEPTSAQPDMMQQAPEEQQEDQAGMQEAPQQEMPQEQQETQQY